MNKVFLSHSSADKEFIRPIAEYFGNDRCVFDEMTFEIGMKTISEIFKHLDSTDIFVFFISENSLSSKWVMRELFDAEKKSMSNKVKLSQIFPIIIDMNITHRDLRIPYFLRTGISSYNLRHIDNYKIACKKIESQLTRLEMNKDILFSERVGFFFGRDSEKKAFKDYFEERTIDGKIKKIKCIVASGVEGIGRKAYIRGVLKDSGLMDRHYFPMIVSLDRNENIEDLIVKISELGFGVGTFFELTKITSLDEKIGTLANLLLKAQDYQEHIIIEDNMSLLSEDGTLKYWFERALDSIRSQMVISIVSPIKLDEYRYRRNQNIFSISLDSMTLPDTIGLLRSYSKLELIPFEEDNLDSLANVLTGYPPQVRFCVDLAREKGISYVTNHQNEVSEMPLVGSARILEHVIESNKRNQYLGILSLLARFGSTPTVLLDSIVNRHSGYKLILARLKRFNICTHIGASGEYIRINATIRDYIQRSDFELTSELKAILNERTENFNTRINNSEYIDFLDFSELVYYIKEELKKNNSVPEKFLYSTIYLQTIIDLYNEGKYTRVLSLSEALKQMSDFELMEANVRGTIQYYYCSALARLKSTKFYAEVDYFRYHDDYVRYNFLLGFFSRINGDFAKAENYYLNVLKRNLNHNKARHELVIIYSLLQDYDAAFDLARKNYKRFPEDIFHIQAYFECLLNREVITEHQKREMQEMLHIVRTKQRIRPYENYYLIEAKFAAYINKNMAISLGILDDGLKKFKTSFFLRKAYFDIQRKFNNVNGMEKTLNELKAIAQNEQSDRQISLLCCECYYEAYSGVQEEDLITSIEMNDHLPDTTKRMLIGNIQGICHRKSIRVSRISKV